MAFFSQADIDELVSCSKEISDPPKKDMKLVGAHLRNDARLIASNGMKGDFGMFMRRNEDFAENFSIGLTYNPRDGRGEFTLLRCNGKHGEYNRSFDPTHPHCDFHIHQATEKAIEAGQAPEKEAIKTTEYASYEEALQFFVKRINLSVKDAQKYFPNRTQDSFQFES